MPPKTMMAAAAPLHDASSRSPLADVCPEPMGLRTVPIMTPTIHMSAPSPTDPMDITTPTNSSAPASATKSPDSDANTTNGANDRSLQPPSTDQASADSIIMPAPAPAAPAVHSQKIVQTAFIHKLYKYAPPRARDPSPCTDRALTLA